MHLFMRMFLVNLPRIRLNYQVVALDIMLLLGIILVEHFQVLVDILCLILLMNGLETLTLLPVALIELVLRLLILRKISLKMLYGRGMKTSALDFRRLNGNYSKICNR